MYHGKNLTIKTTVMMTQNGDKQQIKQKKTRNQRIPKNDPNHKEKKTMD